MAESRYLIDTNAVIDYLGGKLPDSGMSFMNDIVDSIPVISVITKIEVLGFQTPVKDYQILENFINDSTLLDLTDIVIDKTIQIRKNHKTKLPDAIIAATATVFNLILITRNTADFKTIEGLEVLNPHSV